jgi:hypothetical protein
MRARVALAGALFAFVATAMSGPPADAKGNSPSTAKALANGTIDALLPTATGPRSFCDLRTQSGFFAKKSSYLDSCTTNDATFQVFAIANAKNGSLNVNSPYVKSQLNALCIDGHAYSTGVKGVFATVYAGGTPDNAVVAQNLAQATATQFSKAPGYVKPFKLC